MNSIVVLDNIRSSHNVGSIIRTVSFFGITSIMLCGTTPGITDRFGRENKKVTKVSLGAEKNVIISYFKTTEECVDSLIKEGYEIIAIEQDSRAEKISSHQNISLLKDSALIFGEETKGISKDILEKCSRIIEIPKKGSKESLNVSVCAGIILSKLSRAPRVQQ